MYANFGQVKNITWAEGGTDVTDAMREMGLPQPGKDPAVPAADKDLMLSADGTAEVGGEGFAVDTSTDIEKVGDFNLPPAPAQPWYKNKWTWIAAAVVVAGAGTIWYARRRYI